MLNNKASDRATSLKTVLEAAGRTSVLVVGDLMLDRFIYGEVDRISPESPVPVLAVKRETVMPGGAGNVLANLGGLGVCTYIVALTGTDAASESLRTLVTQAGADTSGLIAAPERPTTVKTRYLAAHQQLLRTDREKSGSISPALEDEVAARATALLPRVKAVILSDYDKGVLTEKTITAIIRAARKAGVTVLVDPKKPDYKIYKGADIITPNRKELAEAVNNMPTGSDDEVTAAAQALADHAGIDSVVATRSRDGMTIVRRDGRKFADPVHLRTEAMEVFDVSGAGDTVIAVIAAAVAAGASLHDAAELANVAAGLVVAKVGTAPVRREELFAALDERREAGSVRDADTAYETVQRWRAQGLKIGFTNGCFDILHAGHVQYLAAARGRCDRLIVGLNTDDSVRRLKGAGRPVNNETARASVMAALSAVDMVVLFGGSAAEDDKPGKLVERLMPDIYFKGGDYHADQLPETPLVQSWGGTVEIMPFHEGHSTTATIGKVKNSRVA
ncbi:MAG TPA: D-glycero-beta-D-manno-heptose-7-phosphate kinase [Alphaproteobacteria bacterium]|jgi:D-beta-D-heptose 7-phosphate kinase/D-beta-D-heptose 1-phosphate adenosyltransferase